jgi:HAE1 family hydrophobic/amphiphilic exporter-1
MAISLVDALTIAPMLSAYFAGHSGGGARARIWKAIGGEAALRGFGRFQDWLEAHYTRILQFTVRRPLFVLGVSGLVFVGSCASVQFVPKTFLPPQDAGEFSVGIDLPPGTNLDAMAKLAGEVDKVIRANPEVELAVVTVGGRDGSPNVADMYVKLVPFKNRKLNTSQFKDKLRGQLKPFAHANPTVKDYDAVAAGMRPFNVNIVGSDQKELERIATAFFQKARKHPGMLDTDINYRPGKPELQIVPDLRRMESLGISSQGLGAELRTQVEGVTPARFRQNGLEYDIRVRLQEDQRDLRESFGITYVPNINGTLVRLADVARPVAADGPAKITRQDRARYIQISSDIEASVGMGKVMTDLARMLEQEEDTKLPMGMRYVFVGQAENFKELGESMALAVVFGVLFIFLVLASLYESFVTPLTIMLALPLAICGAFVALFVTRESLNIFSMIGCIMLMGVAAKNSILLVDYAHQLIEQGKSRAEALVEAGRTRLRPILMTTMALIAGTLPVALGLNEASRQRSSMGIAIVGGLISSTLLTLVVVPAAFSYIDRFRLWSSGRMKRLFGTSAGENGHARESEARI